MKFEIIVLKPLYFSDYLSDLMIRYSVSNLKFMFFKFSSEWILIYCYASSNRKPKILILINIYFPFGVTIH